MENYEKKYKEALCWMRKIYPTMNGCDKEDAERHFPELVESEDDRIRKELIKVFSNKEKYLIDQSFGDITISEILAWLKKQNKRINLIEVLKHYPKETELYSPLWGRLWLAEVDEEYGIITCYKHRLESGCTRAILEQEDTVSFYSNGTTGLPDCTVSKDCMLFLYEKQDEKIDAIKNFDTEFEKQVSCLIASAINKECEYNQGYVKWIANALLNYAKHELEKQDEQNLAEYEEGLIDETKQSSPSLVMTESTRIGRIKVLKNLRSYLKYETKSTQEEIKLSFIPCIENLLEEIEQKPADSVKPKYHEGEWVVFDCGEESKTLQIKEIIGKEYVFNDGTRLDIVDEDSLHLWTINDAKDGDVLCAYDCGKPNILFKFKGRAKKHNALIYYFYYNVEIPYINGTTGCFYPIIEDVRPATNGQRKLLILQMHTAGYEWYGDLKELCKILTS